MKVFCKTNTPNTLFGSAHPARSEVGNLLDRGEVHEVGLRAVHAPVSTSWCQRKTASKKAASATIGHTVKT